MINNYFTTEEIQEKSVIDDFAKYVARNGIDYELMTKHKQLGNPSFSFLFGGRLGDYYRHKLEEERNILASHDYSYQHDSEYTENNMMLSYAPSSNEYQHGFDFTQNEYFQSEDALMSMKDKVEQQRIALQIMQEENYRLLSESQNHMNEESDSINKNKIVQCMTIVNMYRLYQTKQQCQEHNIDYESMEKCMDAILASCTKDNICNGKNWVIEHCSNGNNHYPLCSYLLAKVSVSTLFNERLHVVYFINDLLHHCKRKNSYNLLEALESVIVPIYSLCVFIADDEGKIKLNKVLSLWETNSYTKKELLDTMRENHVNSLSYMNNWFDSEINTMQHTEEEETFKNLYLKDEETISHVISDARLRQGTIEANYNQMKYELNIKEETVQMEIYQLERSIMEMETNKINRDIIHHESTHEESISHDPSLLDSVHYNCFQENQIAQNSDFQFHMPDISRPPPGFNITDLSQMDMSSEINTNIPELMTSDIEISKTPEKQSIPYWRLPAALMVSHIRLSQFEYCAIDPKDIKLPQLKPPSKRLLDISNNFYQLPSHDRPRDTDGWERLALHDFLKAKEKAKIGEIIDDFVSCLHFDKNDDEDYDYNGYDESAADVEYEYEELSDFKRNFPPPGTLNNDYRHNQLLGSQFGTMPTNFSPRVSNQRSLLGYPWEEYSPKSFSGNLDSSGRSFNYNNGSSRPISLLGNVPRSMPQKIVPLMSLGLPTNMKRNSGIRSSKRGTFSRNSDDSYNDRKRSKRRYSSRSRSRSGSRSKSRSRSQSTVYSRSRSRSYSRSRSNSRSMSRSRSGSSQSSHGSDSRPYKGGFIARKRSKSRSRSSSRSPKPRSSLDANYSQSSLMQNLPDRRVWSGMRSELINPDLNSQLRQEDPFSRFRQNKSASYSEWMKDRVVRRPYEEETSDNF